VITNLVLQEMNELCALSRRMNVLKKTKIDTRVHNNMIVFFFTAAVRRVHIVVITIVTRQRPNSSTTAVG